MQYVRLVQLGVELGADLLAVEASWPEEVQEKVLESKGSCKSILSFTDDDERFYSAGELRMTLAIMANAWGMYFILPSSAINNRPYVSPPLMQPSPDVLSAVHGLISPTGRYLIWLLRQARSWMPCKWWSLRPSTSSAPTFGKLSQSIGEAAAVSRHRCIATEVRTKPHLPQLSRRPCFRA